MSSRTPAGRASTRRWRKAGGRLATTCGMIGSSPSASPDSHAHKEHSKNTVAESRPCPVLGLKCHPADVRLPEKDSCVSDDPRRRTTMAQPLHRFFYALMPPEQ